jgi:Fe-S-cluster containining protein
VAKGIIGTEELDKHKKAVEERLKDNFKEAGIGVRVQNVGIDKYSLQGEATIDCEKRLPICRAACCKLAFALSLQDIREGIRWSLGKPFMNVREEDGYCVNLERDTCKCRIYEQRPVVCRQYDCRNDRRIWLDFDAMTINPAIFAKGDSPCIETNSDEEPTQGDQI